MKQPQDNLPELIDCCRSQPDDLTLPEMQHLAVAIQADPELNLRLQKARRIDALIAQSLRDVPIPIGLEERLLASVLPTSSKPDCSRVAMEGDQAQGLVEVSRDSNSRAATEVAIPVVPASVRRNRWQIWTAVAASLVAVAGVAFLILHESVPSFATPRDVASHSQRWLDSLTDKWAYDRIPTDKYPPPAQQRFLRQIYRWQDVTGASSALKVVCYNISPPQPATHLFVCLGSNSPALPTTPPAPYSLKPGWLVGGWQSNGFVYVLVVQGNERQYQALIQRTQNVASALRPQTRA